MSKNKELVTIKATLNKGVQEHGRTTHERITNHYGKHIAIFGNAHTQSCVLFLKCVCVRVNTRMYTCTHTYKKISGRFHTNIFTVITPGVVEF